VALLTGQPRLNPLYVLLWTYEVQSVARSYTIRKASVSTGHKRRRRHVRKELGRMYWQHANSSVIVEFRKSVVMSLKFQERCKGEMKICIQCYFKLRPNLIKLLKRAVLYSVFLFQTTRRTHC
jgi:hypothetical protein